MEQDQQEQHQQEQAKPEVDAVKGSFLETLATLREGRTAYELTGLLQGLVAAVKETGRKGKITLTITVAPFKPGQTTAVSVSDEVDPKFPKPTRDSTLFFTTDDDQLLRTNPRQPEFPYAKETE